MKTISKCPINFDRYMENKIENTIQRRYQRERRIKNGLWIFLAIAILVFIFSCSSDNDTCNCRKEVYNNSIQFLHDQPADESKCTGDKALRSDGNGNMYRYQCK